MRARSLDEIADLAKKISDRGYCLTYSADDGLKVYGRSGAELHQTSHCYYNTKDEWQRRYTMKAWALCKITNNGATCFDTNTLVQICVLCGEISADPNDPSKTVFIVGKRKAGKKDA